MRALLYGLLAAWLAVSPSLADSAFVAPSATGQAATGQTNQGASTATVTITIASPAVVTWGTTIPYAGPDANGLKTCAVVNFTTTGALPTGLVAGTNYYVIGASISGNTFQLATSVDNCIAGTAINTTGSQSGTQTGVPTAILATGTAIDVLGIGLTAGDWDVRENITFAPGATTTVSLMTATISTTSVNNNNIPGARGQVADAAAVLNANTYLPVGPYRISIASTTTIYCTASGVFGISTLAVWGGCFARRVR